MFDSNELPALQPRTHCVLMPRDPHNIYAYWDYTEEDINKLRHQLKLEGKNPQCVLRVYDTHANHSWDIDVGFSIKSWYIDVEQDDTDYCAELGMRINNHFTPLMRSNRVHTPPKSVSKRDDLIWQDIKIYKRSQPYIRENIKKAKKSSQGRIFHLSPQDVHSYYTKFLAMGSLKEKFKGVSWQKVHPLVTNFNVMRGASENLLEFQARASEGFLSARAGGSEGRLNKRQFVFEIWTELLVYGRTETDAKVLLGQKQIKLNPDGTFSLRYALPDGEIPLNFVAQSSDGVQERHINTRVEREKTTGYSND